MQILRNLFILIMVLATVQLNSYSKLSHHAPAEAHVLQTLTYGIAGKSHDGLTREEHTS